MWHLWAQTDSNVTNNEMIISQIKWTMELKFMIDDFEYRQAMCFQRSSLLNDVIFHLQKQM